MNRRELCLGLGAAMVPALTGVACAADGLQTSFREALQRRWTGDRRRLSAISDALSFRDVSRLAQSDPAFLWFAGLPDPMHLSPRRFATWVGRADTQRLLDRAALVQDAKLCCLGALDNTASVVAASLPFAVWTTLTSSEQSAYVGSANSVARLRQMTGSAAPVHRRDAIVMRAIVAEAAARSDLCRRIDASYFQVLRQELA
jgi:hypothetical protein